MKPPEPPPAAFNQELPDSPIATIARALPPGARLEEFEIGEVIGEGSAAIVYAASDYARAVPVAIAEYTPARLAQRNGARVTPRTAAFADDFAKGLKAFIKESRVLTRCFHPSLVRIARLWEAHGTAYRVMPRYPSRRLLEVRRGMNEPPDEESVRALLDALLGALGVFHQAGGGHGKVTPSNILLLADNRPLLLGPGAAGRAIAGDRIDALMTEPCFAPIEQMVESADTPLRPSVDLYALAGVARYWISGQLPAPAFGAPDSPRRERLADTVERLRLTWPHLHYSASLLDALDNALSIYPAERPQGVAQMRARLGTAPAAAGGPMVTPTTAVPASNDVALNDAAPNDAVPNDVIPNDVLPSAPAPALEPAPPGRVTQDFDVASAPELAPLATSVLARIDVDPSVRTAFGREVRSSRRIAKWSGAVLVLLTLLLGVFEFGQEGQVGRVLDTLGISHGTSVEQSAAVSTPAVGPAAQAPPPMVADAASQKPEPTEPSAADSVESTPSPASPAGAPTATDAGNANPTSTETTAAESAPSAAAPASPASSSSAPLSAAAPATSAAAPAASVAPPAIASPPPASVTPSPTHTAQHRATRAPLSPREACGARTQFSLYRCMKTQCSQRRWASHAQCQRLRITDSVD